MQEQTPKVFRIGELAKRAGKTVRTIHFYEELGLLHPAERSPGGFRMYTDDALTRIHWIEQIQELGFSLTDIRGFLDNFQSHETGPEAMGVLRGFYREKIEETRATIEKMKTLEAELESSLQYLEACQDCSSTASIQSCASCDSEQHSDSETPCMVAAIATSA